MKVVSILFLCLVLLAETTYTCTLAKSTLSEFDETEYVFIGKVVGYTKPSEFKIKNDSPEQTANRGETARPQHTTGLVVKVVESVFLPKQKTEFEIFSYTLWADCSIGGITSSKLEADFPVNSEIRVIAKEGKYLVNPTNERLKLEYRPGESGQLVVNSEPKTKSLASAVSIFDYASYKNDIDDSSSKYLLPSFEARKDLLRLRNARNQQEKTSILQRMMFLPISSDVDVLRVFRKHSGSEYEFEGFYCRRLIEIEGLSAEDFQLIKDELPKRCSDFIKKPSP